MDHNENPGHISSGKIIIVLEAETQMKISDTLKQTGAEKTQFMI